MRLSGAGMSGAVAVTEQGWPQSHRQSLSLPVLLPTGAAATAIFGFISVRASQAGGSAVCQLLLISDCFLSQNPLV